MKVAGDGDFLPGLSSRTADYIALAKPGLTILSVSTAAGAAALAPGDAHYPTAILHTVIGTLLVGGGAATLNQYLERSFDGMMRRTAGRPLPSGRMDPLRALGFGLVLAALGVAYLWALGNEIAAALGALILVSYVLVYTPLKRRTPLATVFGGIPGALPPLVGWAMAAGTISSGGVALSLILFCWQMPHFLSLSWIYRNEYAKAGYRTLTAVDPGGDTTAIQTVLYALALFAASLLPVFVSLLGGFYLAGASLSSTVFLGLAFRFALKRSNASARQLFLASLAYLPLLGLFMLLDRL